MKQKIKEGAKGWGLREFPFGCYILVNRKPVFEPNGEKWQRWMEEKKNNGGMVALTKVGPYYVMTQFKTCRSQYLVDDWKDDPPQPLLQFKTEISVATKQDLKQHGTLAFCYTKHRRYLYGCCGTWKNAKRQHQMAVAELRKWGDESRSYSGNRSMATG